MTGLTGFPLKTAGRTPRGPREGPHGQREGPHGRQEGPHSQREGREGTYFGHKRDYSPLSPDESEHLRRWVLLANTKGHYSRGSGETILDQDLAILGKTEARMDI